MNSYMKALKQYQLTYSCAERYLDKLVYYDTEALRQYLMDKGEAKIVPYIRRYILNIRATDQRVSGGYINDIEPPYSYLEHPEMLDMMYQLFKSWYKENYQ